MGEAAGCTTGSRSNPLGLPQCLRRAAATSQKSVRETDFGSSVFADQQVACGGRGYMTFEETRVVLLNPPFFRALGSHNDNAPLQLCYLSRFLHDAAIDHVVYNADATGASKLWKWGKLFERFDLFKLAVEGRSPVIFETVENILSMNPEIVFVNSADSFLPAVDHGNAFIAHHIAALLRAQGVYTVGCGLFYSLDPSLASGVDCVYKGLADPQILEVIARKPRGETVQSAAEIGVIPEYSHLIPLPYRDAQVLSAVGCAWRCSFCLSPRITPRVHEIPLERVVADVAQRQSESLYWGDLVFPLKLRRLRAIRDGLRRAGIAKRFSCESRVDTLSREKLEVMADMGVRLVKVGVESFSESALQAMNKQTSRETIARAVGLLDEFGMKKVAYIMLGGPGVSNDAYWDTLAFCEGIGFDHYVVNIWGYDGIGLRDYRYDAHFSADGVARWGIDRDVLQRFLDLQQAQNPTVGPLFG